MQKNANNFIGLNIKYLNDREKITQDEFGAVLGLKRGAISSYINKGIKPKYQTIKILSEKFQIPIDDLLNKDISILKVEDPGTSGLPGKSVPYWNLPVTAGRSLGEIIGQLKPDGYISGLPGADMAENILPVTGTSMEPEVPEGALIGVRKMDNWETLNTGRIYLITTHDDRMIKRIEHDAENEAILWCTSPNYPKFKIYKSDIIEIHRVCFIYFAK